MPGCENTPHKDLMILKCRFMAEITERLFAAMDAYADLLPASKQGLILLKPNLNANMNALTGNTTDLRILSVLITYLKDKGYTNILIGEGTNSGFYRNKIGVIARLRVDALAKHHGVGILDLNYAKPHRIEFANGVQAQVAEEVVNAELFINLPKLKTHFEAGMSVCLKNLMGCLIGQDNKKKVHDSLAENILRLNRQVRPHLHIVDGLVAMEGLGPTKGTPLRLDTLIVGTDPFLIDLVCARLARFAVDEIRPLALAREKGLLTSEHFKACDKIDLTGLKRNFAPPKAGPLASFIHHPSRQKFFLKIRNTPFFTYLASTRWFGHLLFITNLRQDVFLEHDMHIRGLSLDREKCDDCGICRNVCPLGFDLPTDFEKSANACINCLYCFCACPRQAFAIDGELGFFAEQMRQYDDLIRKLFT